MADKAHLSLSLSLSVPPSYELGLLTSSDTTCFTLSRKVGAQGQNMPMLSDPTVFHRIDM